MSGLERRFGHPIILSDTILSIYLSRATMGGVQGVTFKIVSGYLCDGINGRTHQMGSKNRLSQITECGNSSHRRFAEVTQSVQLMCAWINIKRDGKRPIGALGSRPGPTMYDHRILRVQKVSNNFYFLRPSLVIGRVGFSLNRSPNRITKA
jgi:hypothetical protein